MHDDLPSWADPDLWLDEDHALEWLTRKGESEPYGAHIWHRPGPNKRQLSATPGWCLGTFQWNGTTGPNWTLVSRDPLHVEPSILCGCGEHGFIRDGKWIPA